MAEFRAYPAEPADSTQKRRPYVCEIPAVSAMLGNFGNVGATAVSNPFRGVPRPRVPRAHRPGAGSAARTAAAAPTADAGDDVGNGGSGPRRGGRAPQLGC